MKLALQNFDIKEADWPTDKNVLLNLRKIVFIVEQNVSPEEEFDGLDDTSWHWLVNDKHGRAIGTGRLLRSGQIGRMAVLEAHRGEGIGAAVLGIVIEKARTLGFDEVFLNAQVHAIGFYEKAGFTETGEGFDEAGIAHQKMTQQLDSVRHESQQYGARVSPLVADIKPFDTSEAAWPSAGKIIKKVRESVALADHRPSSSTVNQPSERLQATIKTTDGQDEACLHWQAKSPEGQVIGSVRMTPLGEISWLAVLEPFRGLGVGYSLLEQTLTRAKSLNLTAVRLHAPAAQASFFGKYGFRLITAPTTGEHHRTNDAFNEQTLQRFECPIERINVAEERSRFGKMNGEDYEASETPYVLGTSKQFLLLTREHEFKNVTLEMCAQASQCIRIWSPVLDHRLFHNTALRESFSKLARKNRYTKIEILIYDTHRIIKNSHAILEICRRLPSSISIRVVHPEFRVMNDEFVLVDNAGIIFRQDAENYDGYANFRDITENNRLARKFQAGWESGLHDPNIRQMKL